MEKLEDLSPDHKKILDNIIASFSSLNNYFSYAKILNDNNNTSPKLVTQTSYKILKSAHDNGTLNYDLIISLT